MAADPQVPALCPASLFSIFTRSLLEHLPRSNWRKCVDEVPDRGALRFFRPDDSHNVKSKSTFQQVVLFKIDHGRIGNLSLLLVIDGLDRLTLEVGLPRLYFDENNCSRTGFLIDRNEINFANMIAIGASDNSQSAFFQKSFGGVLTSFSQSVFVPGSGRKTLDNRGFQILPNRHG